MQTIKYSPACQSAMLLAFTKLSLVDRKSVRTNANAVRARIDVTPLCARYKRKNFDFVELRACARANSEGIARACAKPWSYLVLASAKNIYKISFYAERRCPLACR